MADRVTLSILPIISGQRRYEMVAVPTVGSDMPDAEVGEVIGDFLRSLQDIDVHVGQDDLRLEIRIY